MNDYLKRWPAPITFEKKGDQIEGELIAWDAMAEKYPVMHLRTPNGMIRIVRLTQTRLHERMVDLDPDIGDRIFIRYEGEASRAAPGLNKTKEFTVQVRPRTPDPGPKQTLTESAPRGNPP